MTNGKIAYKGFNEDMTCMDFKFEEGKTYEIDGDIKLCSRGFHSCCDPIDCFKYYPPASSVYREVIIEDVSDEKGEDSKVVSKKITIGKKIDTAQMCEIKFDYVKERTTEKCTGEDKATAGDYGAATAGDCGAATAGYRGAATAGDCGAATAGYRGAATAGTRGAATAGYRGAATAGTRGAATAGTRGAALAGTCGAALAGNYGAATAGDYGAATAGDYGAATAGDCGAATAGYGGLAEAGDCGSAISFGSSAVGCNGIACARGQHCKVKGDVGAVLVLAEDSPSSREILDFKAFVVDGKQYKENTWYCIENGEIKECKE